jgi:hypothetical protein
MDELKKEYDVDINIKVEYGNYSQCYYEFESSIPGEYLSTNMNNYSKKLLLIIDILMNQTILNDIKYIEIYDKEKKLLQYSKEINSTHYRFVFSVDESLQESNLLVLFRQIDKEKGYIKIDIYHRPPLVTLYEETISVPKLEILGDDSYCAICIKKIDNLDKYISPCKHLLHISCLFNYLENNNALIKKLIHCKQFCMHSNKPSEFSCPICTSLIDHSKRYNL